MELWEYTNEVLRTYAGSDNPHEKLCLGALGLGGESGEVIDLIKKTLFQGHELDRGKLLDEIGDVLWAAQGGHVAATGQGGRTDSVYHADSGR